jgi:NTP pyrophosphatase (non-canonical NTP hydrolase)
VSGGGLSFSGYSEAAASTQLPGCKGFDYLALGLCSEAGEVAGKLKKLIRDEGKPGTLSPEVRLEIAQEVGDVLWYVDRLAAALGCDLQQVAAMNAAKLKDRMERGRLKGSGDSR